MPLKITARQTQPLDLNADVVVMGTWTFPKAKGDKADKKKKKDDGKHGTGVAFVDALDRALGGGVSRLIAKEEFTGKKDQTLSVPTLGRLPAAKLVLLGLGDRDKAGPAEVRSFAAKAARIGNAEKAKTIVLAIPDGLETRLRTVAEGLDLGAYRFTKYLTGDRKPKESLDEVTIASERRFPPDGKRAIALGQAIAAGVNVSRDLSNEPPNVMFPMALAKAAQEAAKEHKLKVTIIDDKEIVKRGMHLLHAVGRGSSHPPVLVHMAYVPSKKSKTKKRYVFVGKGITFDTGGISIKPAQGMGEMKHDMSGAANMVGLMIAVAALKPNIEVHGIMSCAENMPDGNSYRPGDVWGSLDGKSVEIINTDAEGRLVLADALAYAAKELEPDLLVDNATLTGACVVALGTTYSAFYASNADTAQRFQAGVKSSGEQMWHMPLIEELRDQLKSDTADLKHTGDRYGGSITAALFLREFIGKTKNWVHADIAGPAQTDRPYAWHGKGATGHGVLTFLSLVERAGK